MRKPEFELRADYAMAATTTYLAEMKPEPTLVWGGIGWIDDPERQRLWLEGQYLNPWAEPNTPTTCYPGFAAMKMMEAAMYGEDKELFLLLGPFVNPETHRGTCGFEGGGRQGRAIFGISGLDQSIDRVVATQMIAAFWQWTGNSVHHIGYSVPTMDEYWAIVAALRSLGFVGYEDDVSSHKRHFFHLGCGIGLEVQAWPDGRSLFHVDTTTPDPKSALELLGEVEILKMETGPNALVAVTSGFVAMGRDSSRGLETPWWR